MKAILSLRWFGVCHLFRPVCVLVVPLAWLAAGSARAITITTAVGNGADVQLNEFNNTPQDTSANNQQINARWASTVNEVIALRFDLSGYTPAALTNVQLELINHRANTARVLHYYGVPDGTPGADNNGTVHGYTDNTWQEGTLKFSTMPGLHYDGDPNTKGFSNVVDLGSATMNATAKGSSVTYSSAALTAFVQSHPDTLITLLVGVDTASTGQSRFASKETTALDGGTPTGAAGDFAPRLHFTIACTSAGISAQPADQQVLAGTPATFTVAATGSGPAYQWQVSTDAGASWNPVTTGTGGDTASYTTAPVALGDSGNQYRCLVTVACDGSSVTSAVATLTVVAPPTISGLSNLAVYAGTDVTLSATVGGVPAPALQWLKEGVELPGETAATLTLLAASPAASGVYSLVASNVAGVVTNSLTLTVSAGDLAPLITGPTPQTVVAGGTATFAATVLGLPVPVLQWFENGVPLVGETAATLTLVGVSAAQDGFTYALVASNSAGLATNSATLTVLVPPAITVPPASVTVTNGQPATFTVAATGAPAPTYQWRKNGTPISGATNSALHFAAVTPADIAAYSVTVQNEVGSVTSSNALLNVYSTMTPVTLAPANDATDLCWDTPLYLTFNVPPVLRTPGTGRIRIYNATNPATPVETLDMALNTSPHPVHAANIQPRVIAGQTINTYPVLITGSTAAIYPRPGVLTSNQTYFVTIEPGVFTDAAGAWHAGLLATNAWRFTTRPGVSATALTNPVVAADGSGDFLTVQGALDFLPVAGPTRRVIDIQDGVYTELIVVAKSNLTLRGQSRDGTILRYYNNANMNGSTRTRMSLHVRAPDVALVSLTATNITPKGGSQAEALFLESGGSAALRFIAYDCLFSSYQDTILGNSHDTPAYFERCTIQGDTDYIWGGATMYFTNCELKMLSNGGHYANPSSSAGSNGMAFVNCRLVRDPAVTSAFLGRTRGITNGNAAFIQCLADAHVGGWAADALPTNSYRLWHHGVSNLTATVNRDATITNSILLSSGDPLLALTLNASNWLYGWVPRLAPWFTHQPSAQMKLVGESVTFTAAAAGLPAPAYQWLKDGVPIPGATAPSLTLTNLAVNDGGVYSVLASNAAGMTTSAGAALVISNRPPTAGFFLLPATENTATSVPAIKLMSVASDPDGDAVAVTAVAPASTNGGAASFSGGHIHYTPVSGYTGPDELAYTLTDARGAAATGWLTILVSPAGVGFNQLAPPEPLGGGQWRLRYLGIPGYAYALEWRTNLAVGDWVPVRTNVAGPDGRLEFTNVSTAPENYYRTRHAP